MRPLVLRPQTKKLPNSSQNVRVRATLARTVSGSIVLGRRNGGGTAGSARYGSGGGSALTGSGSGVAP